MKNLIGILVFAFIFLWALLAEQAFAQVTADQLRASGMPVEQANIVAGVFTGGSVVGNNAYIQARNAANSANNQLLKSDGSDNTFVNAPSGSSVKVLVAGTPKAIVSATGITLDQPLTLSASSTPIAVFGTSGFTTDVPFVANAAPRLAPYVPTMTSTPVAGTNDFKIGVNAVPTAAANTSALMPTPAAAGQMLTVVNTGPNTVRVKPGGTNTINGATAGAYVPLATGAVLDCESTSATAWWCGSRAVPTPAGP